MKRRVGLCARRRWSVSPDLGPIVHTICFRKDYGSLSEEWNMSLHTVSGRATCSLVTTSSGKRELVTLLFILSSLFALPANIFTVLMTYSDVEYGELWWIWWVTILYYRGIQRCVFLLPPTSLLCPSSVSPFSLPCFSVSFFSLLPPPFSPLRPFSLPPAPNASIYYGTSLSPHNTLLLYKK